MPSAMVFTLVSPDGDAGYPGTLTVKAEYTWSDAVSYTHLTLPTILRV